ncbi:MAG: tRNA 4-thiouridine(8) synthase ThiI [Bacteroidia bacterium]|nr:tRNA 4-thiouridine(8) synthase ThiI [Bacteroidia bacterium]
MKYDRIMVRYGELSTKGRNKMDFIKLLATNIRKKLSEDFDDFYLETRYDHIYIVFHDNDPHEMIEKLQEVSGINSLTLVTTTEKHIDVITKTALEMVQELEASTFKVQAKRSDKRFPIISDEINRLVAKTILGNTSLKVNVREPDLTIGIEVRDEAAYLFLDTYKGAGGYPLGIAGKVMMMVSGGIDSPVAAYLLMKRGVSVECIHFASPPYTNTAVVDKVVDLLRTLTTYQTRIRLHIVPFTKIQEAIYDNVDESYTITIMRRMMFRIAEKLASKRKCQAIASGESIGQVASQTLGSMRVINEVTNMTVIRPLITYDKNEIIALAKRIKTYDISIRPFEDCCTIFHPHNPKTRPNFQATLMWEEKFSFDDLIFEAVKETTSVIVSSDDDDLQ